MSEAGWAPRITGVPATGSSDYLTAEAQARKKIDEQLVECGWVVQDYRNTAVTAAQGVAVRWAGS